MEFTTHFELQSQATRLVDSVPYADHPKACTGLSPSRETLFQGTYPQGAAGSMSLDYNSVKQSLTDSQVELFPLHSPLLGESWLVSFPPLSYMLKFSGWPCLIGGPMFKEKFGMWASNPRRIGVNARFSINSGT